MGTVYDILTSQGKVAAIQSFDREIVEAASLYMSADGHNALYLIDDFRRTPDGKSSANGSDSW